MRIIIAFILLPFTLLSQDLTLIISDQDVPSCAGASDGVMTLLAEGGVEPYVYSIVGGDEQDSPVFDGLTSGDYEFSVMDNNGDLVTLIVTLAEGPNLSLNINDIDPSCMEAQDGQLMITEVNGIDNVTYEIAGPVSDTNMTGIFTNLPVGTYVVSASTSSECTIVISTILSSDVECEEALSLSVINQTSPSCNDQLDGAVILMASGGIEPYLFSIVNGVEQDSSSFLGLDAGEYEFSVTDADGNMETIILTLINEINLSIDIVVTDPSCEDAADGQLEITEANGNGVSYELSGATSASNTTGTFDNLPKGSYDISVTSTSNSQCSITLSTTLSSDIDCPEDPNICPIFANRIGMQINMMANDRYTLRVHYQDEVDVIKNVSFTSLYNIIEFHLFQRQMNVSLKNEFEFSNYCSDVESLRTESNDAPSTASQQITESTQKEINLIRDFVTNIKAGESLKI